MNEPHPPEYNMKIEVLTLVVMPDVDDPPKAIITVAGQVFI